ncbi:MFS transporter [Prevotella merdae]|uniref:MFS transporter n=1 Tax=Prevotella merdae TaxID=2079531 RepID=UPI003564C30A
MPYNWKCCSFYPNNFGASALVVEVPVGQKLPLSVQLKSVLKNRPYQLAILGQFLFGFILYGRNADILYYFTYVEGSATLFSYYSMAIILPSIAGAACFPWMFRKTGNKGYAAAVFALLCGIFMALLYFFSPNTTPIEFYVCSAIAWFFFSGFNTAIYAVIPDCVEYGEWKTGIRNDGFQYAFVSLANKMGMALGTAMFALALDSAGYVAGAEQNADVIAIMRHTFSTIPGALWVVTALCLCFYKLHRHVYNKIVEELRKVKK